ncbi:MAG: acetylxylan esterase [Acidobacteria bacterium]|nr:acetylxylan esterase [Acidobacteriota bacterium]
MQSRREELYGLLGELPYRDRRISAEVISVEERGGYVLERLELDLNGFEAVPAWFARPKGLSGRAPAVLYNHAHGGDYALGKDEFICGRPSLQSPPYADVLTSLGFCGLGIDAWVFGERATRSESDVFKEMLWKGQVLWGMMVYDSLRALDYLASRPEVDPSRLGTLGLSMGSTMAWWVAALDERIRACVDICCLTDYQALLETDGLKEHGIYYYVPSLLKHFTAAQINALIAPRAHLSLAGNLDPLTPAAGLDRIDRELKSVYTAAGHPERWRLLRYDSGHQETPEMRAAIVAFFEREFL